MLASLPTAPALAYWQLTPQVEGGIVFENNPRYISDQSRSAVLALNPDAADNALGVFLDLRLEG